jgi:dCMP deaminase
MSRQFQKMNAFMRMAREVAALSTCKRKSCGALLITPDFSEILAIGYNGPPAGMPNDLCTGLEGNCGCLHAEANTLVKARRHSATGLILVVTRAPCPTCAGLVINSRAVTHVVFGEDSTAGYGPDGGLRLLANGRINFMRLINDREQ